MAEATETIASASRSATLWEHHALSPAVLRPAASLAGQGPRFCGKGRGPSLPFALVDRLDLRRLPTENHFDQALSTERCQAAILMDVHSALPRNS
jgi:hypothetical protein